MTNQTLISQDTDNKKIFVDRMFNAPLDKVWQAWTSSELLDKWWAPKPWKAKTSVLDFRNGGLWLYLMAGPNGDGQWCRVDFKEVKDLESFVAVSAFCDESGNITNEIPQMTWNTKFLPVEGGTLVKVELGFESTADLEKLVAMGFKEGFTMGLGNLEELLANS